MASMVRYHHLNGAIGANGANGTIGVIGTIGTNSTIGAIGTNGAIKNGAIGANGTIGTTRLSPIKLHCINAFDGLCASTILDRIES